MIEGVEVVPYGRPASLSLAAAVAAAKRAGPLAPVTVIVPSNLAGLTARRLLGAGTVAIAGTGGVANVAFLTPFRLAELLSVDALLDTRPLTNPVLGAAVRLALAEAPGPFAPVADHFATEAAVAALYAELSNVGPATLDRLAREGGSAAREAVALFGNVRAHLGAFHEEADVARAAAARAGVPGALDPLGRVVWFLPQPVTAPLQELLRAVLAGAATTVVVGATGDADADEPVWATCVAAGVPRPPTVGIAEPGAEPTPPVAARIVSVTDADEEVRAVVREIAALAEQRVPLDRIGVFHPAPDPYVGILEQQLEAAGIPANGPSRRRLADSVAGRTLLAALHLPDQRWRRDRVLAVVSGGPLRHADGRVRPSAWEDLSRRAGVVQDLADWHRKLGTHRAAIGARLEDLAEDLATATAGPGDGDGTAAARRAALEREVADTDQLRAFVDHLADGVARVQHESGWAAKAEAATALLHDLLGGGHLHARWPEPEQAAFEQVERALVRLASLGELEPDPTHAVFVRALAAELDVTRGRAGRFGEGVVYGPLTAAPGHDLDAVFILGCSEGLCPSPRREDALLPDHARALAPGELELRAARLGDQHRAFLAALASAPAGARVLTFARSDLRGGREALPSRWLLDSASALAGDPVYATDFHDLADPVVHVVRSFVSGLDLAPVHGGVDERDLAAIRAQCASLDDVIAHPAAAASQRGLVAQADRRSPALTAWDGNLAGQPIPTTADRPLSPSRLEAWAACGYRYFLGHVLGLADREDPERLVDISPLDRGSAVHSILELFFREVIEAGAPEPDQQWSTDQRRRMHEIADEVFAGYESRGRTGRALHWRIAQADLHALLDDFLTADDAFRAAAGCRPEQVELPFGLDAAEPVRLTLPDGRTLQFRGRADRVDRAGDGTLLVSDYKTGKGAQYRKIGEGDPVREGATLQLGLYAEAAIQLLGAPAAEAHYWMVDARVRFARLGYPWTAPRRARLLTVLGVIADGIEGGTFPALPGEYDNFRGTHEACTYCDFDSVCPRDRGEQARRKAGAPEVGARSLLAWEGDQ